LSELNSNHHTREDEKRVLIAVRGGMKKSSTGNRELNEKNKARIGKKVRVLPSLTLGKNGKKEARPAEGERGPRPEKALWES